MILVSIIIPIYNQEKYLPDCLASVEKQSIANMEVILVNDGSTDRSQKIIDEFCMCHQTWEIITINRKNGGLSAARNSGIRKSRGKYIYFLDADDSISDNCLRYLVDFAEKYSADVVMGENYIIKDEEKTHIRLGFNETMITGNQVILQYYTERLWYNVAWNKLVKAEIIKNNQLYFSEGNIFEDSLWTFQLATYIKSLGAVHLPTYNYFIRSGSQSIMQSNSAKHKRWMKYIPILKEMSTFIKEKLLYENSLVGRFFLQELNHTIYGLQDCGELSKSMFDELKNLCNISLTDLYLHKLINCKELIAYCFYNLPPFIDYFYFRTIKLCMDIKRRIH
jgi:glycosyltransferase involved in cell wall biosynthesis